MTTRVALLGHDFWVQRTSRALREEGLIAQVPEHPRTFKTPADRVRRWRTLLASDVIYGIGGHPHLGSLQRSLARLGLPSVVQWVGTDVMNHASSVGSDAIRWAWNWAGAPWLAEELAPRIDVDMIVPSPCRQIPSEIPPIPRPFSVIAYTPEFRADFYGIGFVLELARRLPDVKFELLATSANGSLPPNVSALGWVEDMDPVWRRAGLLLRPVEHDGMSNMVLEALAYGRYALWSYSIPGAERITTLDAAEAYIRGLIERGANGSLVPNLTGRSTIENEYGPDLVAERMKDELEAVAMSRWRESPPKMERVLATVVLFLLRLAFLVPRWPGGHTDTTAIEGARTWDDSEAIPVRGLGRRPRTREGKR